MKLTIIESPYAGEVERNLEYVRACMRDSLARGEAPYASHALYTQPGVLDDDNPIERKLGIEAGFAWWRSADNFAFYIDRGWSRGMKVAHERAVSYRVPFEIRTLDGWTAGDCAPGCTLTREP